MDTSSGIIPYIYNSSVREKGKAPTETVRGMWTLQSELQKEEAWEKHEENVDYIYEVFDTY